MIDSKELAKYIMKRMREKFMLPVTLNELEFWIEQYKTKDCCGHSEWSERFQRNIWIKDEEEC